MNIFPCIAQVEAAEGLSTAQQGTTEEVAANLVVTGWLLHQAAEKAVLAEKE